MAQERIHNLTDILITVALCLAYLYGTIESICHQKWLLILSMGLSVVGTLYSLITWKKNKKPFTQTDVYMFTAGTIIWWIFFFFMDWYPSLTAVCIVSSIQTLYQWIQIKAKKHTLKL